MEPLKRTPKRRATIGSDPLDAVVPFQATQAGGHRSAMLREASEPAPRRARKVRATFHVPEDLFEQVRDAVVHLSGPPARLTLAATAEGALRRELERLKEQYNDGEDFPPRESELRGGRPIGS
jgi:hypothetical protein